MATMSHIAPRRFLTRIITKPAKRVISVSRVRRSIRAAPGTNATTPLKAAQRCARHAAPYLHRHAEMCERHASLLAPPVIIVARYNLSLSAARVP